LSVAGRASRTGADHCLKPRPVTFGVNEAGLQPAQQRRAGDCCWLAAQSAATWVACSASDADASWGEGELPLPEGDQPLHLHFLTSAPEAYEGYYNVIANPLLWFLQHSMWDVPRAPVITQSTWEAWRNGYVG
jgi:trehalose-6-phosphate synthase